MLKQLNLIIPLILVIGFSDTFAETINKVSIDDTAICSGEKLILNGAGIRKKIFIKLYVASLYVENKTDQEKQLLEMNQALCMRLHITSAKITAEKMVKATREGFEKSTQNNTAPIADEIETFLNWLKQPIKKGDFFEFSFTPTDTTVVSKNNQSLGEISNKEFSTALFGIWLGSSPAQVDLKNKLLGN